MDYRLTSAYLAVPSDGMLDDLEGRLGPARRIAVLDAPSNLGLRPPADGVVPGVYKLAGALRDARLVSRMHGRDRGVVVPPRYRPDWDGKTTRNKCELAQYSERLATRVASIINDNEFALVLGGDCSILIGTLRAAARAGRTGLVFIDGHSDFRHLGNSEFVGSAAGEDLAIVCGFGDPLLANPDGRTSIVAIEDVALLGVRDHDEGLAEVRERGATTFTASQIGDIGARKTAAAVRQLLRERRLDRFWVHVDVDVLDATVMPAVDTPERDGIGFNDLVELVRVLTAMPQAVGLDVTIFDPDLDPDGTLAAQLADALVSSLMGRRPPSVHREAGRPLR
jgi:arginase